MVKFALLSVYPYLLHRNIIYMNKSWFHWLAGRPRRWAKNSFRV